MQNQNDIIEDAESKVNSTLNGAQTSSLIGVVAQFQNGTLSEGQAVNIIARSIGCSKEEAREILLG